MFWDADWFQLHPPATRHATREHQSNQQWDANSHGSINLKQTHPNSYFTTMPSVSRQGSLLSGELTSAKTRICICIECMLGVSCGLCVSVRSSCHGAPLRADEDRSAGRKVTKVNGLEKEGGRRLNHSTNWGKDKWAILSINNVFFGHVHTVGVPCKWCDKFKCLNL